MLRPLFSVPAQRATLLLLAAALLAAVAPSGRGAGTELVIIPTTRPAGAGEYRFHRDPVLGTSMDLIVVIGSEDKAQAFEAAVLAEIDRVAKIISTYDPASEVSHLTVTDGPKPASRELLDVLGDYDTWRIRSGGAYNGQLGALIQTWKDAEKAGKVPDDATLAQRVREISQPAWRADPIGGKVTRLTDTPFNLNSLGKGFIIDKALAAARAKVPEAIGAMLDIGGDVKVWGSAAATTPGPGKKDPWQIGVADPFHPQDNAPPLTAVLLTDQYIATSGSYERFYTIGGKRYSHIFDPRTGKPVEGIASATVVAKDGATANALATTLCVLPPPTSLTLIRNTPGAECLIITADGKQVRSPGFAKLEVPHGSVGDAAAAGAGGNSGGGGNAAGGGGWLAGYEVDIELSIKAQPAAKKYHRPYVAVWVEDAGGKPVRMLCVWGNAPKYWPTLGSFWQYGKTQAAEVKTISRATRQPGQYSLAWDGKDDAGKPAAQGTYTIRIEATREGGGHMVAQAKLDCLGKPATATIAAGPELDDTKLTYGPRGTP
jgi:FAD:protein FMN transferase